MCRACRVALAIAVVAVAVMVLALATHPGKALLHRVAHHARGLLGGSASFSKADWTNHSLVYQKPYSRSWMVQDLMKRYRLVGMNKTGIQQLLGKPDSSFGSTYHYFLSPDGWGDANVLELDFSGQGKVKSAKISSS